MDFTGKRILVVGLARSGMAAIKALNKRGAILTAYDAKAAADLKNEIELLHELGVEVFAGTYPPVSQAQDMLIVSPGVPLDIELVQTAYKEGIQVIGELELAFLLKSPRVEFLAVTGTNGKTTTTTLLEQILRADGRNTAVGGNIGIPLCNQVEEMDEGYISVETSSFQLASSQNFRPHVAAILNITPDHLDRHKTMEEYIKAKSKVFTRQSDQDFLILNYEDQALRELASQAKSRVVFFSTERELNEGFYISKQSIQINWAGTSVQLLPLKDIRLRGKHNLENILCAVAMAWVDGVSESSMASVLRSFSGVRHRLEEVANHNDILYINDSKGTNPDSTIKALESFDQPIVLIAGGRPKGGSYAAVAQIISQRVKELVILGEAKEIIKAAVMDFGYKNIHEVEDFPAAVYKAHELAQPGDVVLLSPACASWDMFPSYEHRGDLFCQLIKSIINDTNK